MRSTTKNLLLFLAFEFIALTIFYFPWLAGDQVFFYQDCTHFFEPLCTFIGKAFHNGHIPLWNPYSYCGMPQVAISSPSLFYPPNWLFGWMSYSQALAVNMIISQAICGLGGYLLVQTIGWGFLPAALAGSILALNGYLFSLSSNYTVVASAAWFPLTILFIYRLSKRVSHVDTVALAASSGMMLLCGRPELSAPSLLVVGALMLVLLLMHRKEAHAKEAFVAQIKGLLLSLLIATPVLLPSLEWLPLSRRSQGLPSAETLMFSANWYDMVNLFLPQPLGDLRLRMSYRPLIEAKYVPYFSSAFVGTLALVLAIMGVRRRGGRLYQCTIALLLFSTLAALGSNLPGLELLVDKITVLSLLRFPSKLLFFTVFCVALLTARGLRQYIETDARFFGAIVVCSAAAIAGGALALTSNIVLPFLSVRSFPQSYALRPQHLIASSLLFWSLIALVLIAILFGLKNKYKTQAAALACMLIPATLLYHAFALCRFGARTDFFQKPSFAASELNKLAKADQKEPRFMALLFDDFTIPLPLLPQGNRQATIAGYQYSRQILRPFINMDFQLPSAFGFEGAMVGEYFYLMLNSYLKSSLGPAAYQANALANNDAALARMLQLTGTHYVVTQDFRYLAAVPPQAGKTMEPRALEATVMPSSLHYLDNRFFELVKQDHAVNVRIYRMKGSMTRAYFTRDWKPYESRDQIVDGIYNAETSGFDPTKMTWVEELRGTTVPPNTKDKGGIRQSTPLPVAEHSPEHLSVDVSSDRDGLVVLCDQWYPGWIARVDGVETAIFRCNGFTRGVFVRAGNHKVSFDYEPKTLFYSYLLAAIGILWALALLVLAFRTAGQPRNLVEKPTS